MLNSAFNLQHSAFSVRLSRLDWLLLLMTVIWGTNYAIVKSAFRELDPQGLRYPDDAVQKV